MFISCLLGFVSVSQNIFFVNGRDGFGCVLVLLVLSWRGVAVFRAVYLYFPFVGSVCFAARSQHLSSDPCDADIGIWYDRWSCGAALSRVSLLCFFLTLGHYGVIFSGPGYARGGVFIALSMSAGSRSAPGLAPVLFLLACLFRLRAHSAFLSYRRPFPSRQNEVPAAWVPSSLTPGQFVDLPQKPPKHPHTPSGPAESFAQLFRPRLFAPPHLLTRTAIVTYFRTVAGDTSYEHPPRPRRHHHTPNAGHTCVCTQTTQHRHRSESRWGIFVFCGGLVWSVGCLKSTSRTTPNNPRSAAKNTATHRHTEYPTKQHKTHKLVCGFCGLGGFFCLWCVGWCGVVVWLWCFECLSWGMFVIPRSAYPNPTARHHYTTPRTRNTSPHDTTAAHPQINQNLNPPPQQPNISPPRAGTDPNPPPKSRHGATTPPATPPPPTRRWVFYRFVAPPPKTAVEFFFFFLLVLFVVFVFGSVGLLVCLVLVFFCLFVLLFLFFFGFCVVVWFCLFCLCVFSWETIVFSGGARCFVGGGCVFLSGLPSEVVATKYFKSRAGKVWRFLAAVSKDFCSMRTIEWFCWCLFVWVRIVRLMLGGGF